VLSTAICNLCDTIHIRLESQPIFTISVIVSGYYFGWAIIRSIYAIIPLHFVTWTIPVLVTGFCPRLPKHVQIFVSTYAENILDLATTITSNKSTEKTILTTYISFQSSPNYTRDQLMEHTLETTKIKLCISLGQMYSSECRQVDELECKYITLSRIKDLK
jgi:hypothetical protein